MNDLAVRDEPAKPVTIQEAKQQTDLIIQQATYWASSMMAVVDKCGMSKTVAGKKYLQVEAWLLIGEFAHVTPVIEWVREWSNANELLGYEARAQLQNEAGQIIGSGESSCGFDAFPCRGKQGSEKDKAAKSAAQTWAISRALRNKFGYVAKLGGYETVPYEEMSDLQHRLDPVTHQAPKPAKSHVSAKAGLGQAILAHCDGDKRKASAILEELTGKTTMTAVNEVEAEAAMKRFEMAYLQVGPDAQDDLPEFETGR